MIEKYDIRQLFIGISNYFPPLDSIWGLLLYVLCTYFISMCMLKCVSNLAGESIDLDKAVKATIVRERKKREEREKIAADIKEHFMRTVQEDDRNSENTDASS